MNVTLPTIHTELEARLASPQGATVCAAYQARLHELAKIIRAQLNNGASPTDYTICRALGKAVDTAAEILERYAGIIESLPTGLPTPATSAHPHPPPDVKR